MREKAIGKLRAAHESAVMVRVHRDFRHDYSLDGFVVGIGRKWAALALTMDGGYFDGHVAFRLRDVKRVTRDRSFQSRFSRLQPEWPAMLETGFDLNSTVETLRSFSAHSPLVSIAKERDSSAIWIGEFLGANGKWIGLHEVLLDASWRKHPSAHKRREVDTISIGSHYLTALSAVAGRAPLREKG
ncbi:hypothetical protein [Leifsonia sp. NPDC058230]|uniref:hypothetical protein n=1 Tax=Leifsonia sp. NPDC058230 TaxID=3346391 RepID=UPI0036DA6CA6